MIYKNYIEMREGMDQWLLAATEKNGELDMNKQNGVFCRGYNAPTLVQNLLKSSLVCRERDTLQTCHPLWSMGRLSVL